MGNLIVPTSEQARKNGSKGGKASAEAKKKRKALKEQLELFLELPLQNKKAKETILNLGLDIKDIDNQMAITIALCQKALKGDTKAFELIRDTIGEKPQEKVNISGDVDVNNPYADLTTEELKKIIKLGAGSDG